MIKFEEHEGKLFSMLEEPVPLTPDAEMPCLVRLIQDDSPMGRNNKNSFISCRSLLYVIDSFVDNKNVVIENGLIVAHNSRFEIIGTFVEEGSNDWAWHQMMRGERIRYAELSWQRFYAIKKGCDYCAFYESDWSEVRLNTRRTYCEFMEYSKLCVPSSWEIYKEPKPLLAEAKVGDLVKLRNGSYSQIVEGKDGSVFKYQNPEVIGSVALFWCDENGDTSRWGKLKDIDIVSTEPLAPEGTAEWAWQMLMLGIPVSHPAEGEFQETYYTKEGFVRCMAKTGWELYEEPKPESQYKVCDWVEFESSHTKGKTFVSVIKEMPNQEHYTIHVNSFGGGYYGIMESQIIRKIKPSEVVIDFGSGISGTIKRWDSTAFHIFHGNSKFSKIHIDALDKETREIVKSLLKAQDEEE